MIDYIVPGFNQGFIVIPNSMTVAQGEIATFNCQHHNADTIGWRVDNSYRLPSSAFGRTLLLPDGGVLYILTINGLSEYNMTRIECVAITNGEHEHISPIAYLYVQGDNFINFYSILC